MARARVLRTPFYRFNSSPEVIRLVVMMYIKYPLSLRNVEDLLHERGIDVCYETVRHWSNRFGPRFAAEIPKKRVDRLCQSNCTERALNSFLGRKCQIPSCLGRRVSLYFPKRATTAVQNQGRSEPPLVPVNLV